LYKQAKLQSRNDKRKAKEQSNKEVATEETVTTK
jgi:hypothetical protein